MLRRGGGAAGGRGARGAGGRSPRGPRAGRRHAAALRCEHGHVEVAEKLLAAGAAVGATDDVRAPRAGEGVAGFSFYIRSVLGAALFCFSSTLFLVLWVRIPPASREG